MARSSENINGFLKGRVKFVTMRGVEKGVSISEDRFLHVKFENNRCLVKLYDLKEKKAITGWITLKNVENLRTSRNSKPVRDELKKELESVIQIVQDNKHRWLEKSEEKEVAEQVLSKFDAEIESKINEELKRILEADNQLLALEPHLDVVIVGERDNKRAILVLLVGSKYGTFGKMAIIVLKGGSRGGKSHMVNMLTLGLNVKDVGRFTKRALDYSDVEQYEVLYIKELGDLEEEESGISRLKFMSGDDRGYYVEYPVRDETTGMMRNVRRLIPAKTVISTTTGISLERQFNNRSWLFPIDESSEQTQKVLQWKAEKKKQEDEKLMGLRKVTDYEYSKEVIRRVIESIEPREIIVPFRTTITRVFNPKSTLRIRGDIDKIYAFVELYSLFNLKRLWKLKFDGKEYYATTPEVAVEALNVIKFIVSQMLVGIETRTKEVLEALNEIDVSAGLTDPRFTGEEAHSIKVHPNLAGVRIDKEIREQIAKRLGVSDDTVRKRLNALYKAGYLSSDEAKGRKGKVFTLLYNVNEILRKLSKESGILRSPDSLMSEMRKEAQDWLKPKRGIQLEGMVFTSSEEPKAKNEKLPTPPKRIPHSSLRENLSNPNKIAEENAESGESRVSRKSYCLCLKSIREDDDTIKLANGRIWHRSCYEKHMREMSYLFPNYRPDLRTADAERAYSYVEEREQDERLTEWLKRGMIPKRDTDLQRGEERSD